MIAVFKHELSMYLNGLTAYLYGAFLLMATGIGALFYNIQKSLANFEYVMASVAIILTALIPILTMKSLAEEKRQRTDQLLYALPLSSTQIILGKFMAMSVIALLPILVISIYPFIFARFGDVYLPASFGAIFAFFLLCEALIAIGMFASGICESQGIAAGITAAMTLLAYYSVSLADYFASTALASFLVILAVVIGIAVLVYQLTKSSVLCVGTGSILSLSALAVFLIDSTLYEGLIPGWMKELSLFEHFYVFVDGIFDLTGIVFFVTVTVFFLLLCIQSFEKRRYNG